MQPNEGYSEISFEVVKERSEVQAAVEIFKDCFTQQSTKRESIPLGYQGGSSEADVSYDSELNYWIGCRTLEGRYWNAFGLGNPFEGVSPSIIVEINFPIEGIDRRVGAVIYKDSRGHLYVGHRGNIGGGRTGIGKEAFLEHIPDEQIVSVQDGDVISKVIAVAPLEAPDFSQKIVAFVKLVDDAKRQIIDRPGTPAKVWWVNQGATYRNERDGGYVWAPQRARNGSPLRHHTNVNRLQIGDIIIHYAKGSIVALGEVKHSPKEAKRPAELPDESWERDGYLAEVQYWELGDAIALQEISLDIRRSYTDGPFTRSGAINQGYLYELTQEVASKLRSSFTDRWPIGSPWSSSEERSVMHVLLKWNVTREAETISRHRSIADEHGAVWWGKFGTSRTSQAKIDRLLQQIHEGEPTFAFLYRKGEVWRTQLQDVTANPEQVKDGWIPTYYSKDECGLFFLVSKFEKLEPEWPLENLVLESNPDPTRMRGALGNQATPMWVRLRTHVDPVNIPPEKNLTMDWLEQKTLWERPALEELCDAISTTSPQVVLAGPPGTGKTWVAQHVATYVTEDVSLARRLVQFHPSYGYEEFIEGLRPVVESGAIVFKRVDGVVLEMVDQIEDESQLHVLVIDEMNRANLPRVFGELMYLFEYRDQDSPIDLQYSRDFFLPRNLKFIGTMNTADRSIRSIDIALRRRFDVFECMPDVGILKRFYTDGTNKNEVGSLFDGFEALNEKLKGELDRHHTIGQTFFMSPHMTTDKLRTVWKRKIGPLIEEYFFDQPDVAEEFHPEIFWPELA